MAKIFQTPGVDVRYTSVYIICVMFVVAAGMTSSTRCKVMQVHQQRVYQQLVADVVINRHHQDSRRCSPLTVVIMALPRLDLNFKKKAVSETWSGLRAGGGSRDGKRTVEAGYRAVAY